MHQAAPFIEAVFAGGPKKLVDTRGEWRTSIQKERKYQPVQVAVRGIEGDKATQPIHGGLHAALCVHLSEHYAFWNTAYGISLTAGAVGENLTSCGLTEDDVFVGDIVRIGSVLAQVSAPRVPCSNLARYIGRRDWVKLTVRENRTGFYLRVMEPGSLQPGDAWQMQERLEDDAAITTINRCMYLSFDPVYAQRMLQMPALSDWWKEQAAERLAARQDHWTAAMQSN